MEQRTIKFRAWDEFPKYEIGEDGSVYSLDYNHTGERRVMSQYVDEDGYAYVFMVVRGRRYKRMVHRLVAMLFVANPANKPQVNHKNSIRNDNREENLEWVTSSENTIHGWESGRTVSSKQRASMSTRFSGEKNPKAKLTEAQVLSIRRLRSKGDTLKSIAERHSISTAQVSAIANNKSWK